MTGFILRHKTQNSWIPYMLHINPFWSILDKFYDLGFSGLRQFQPCAPLYGFIGKGNVKETAPSLISDVRKKTVSVLVHSILLP